MHRALVVAFSVAALNGMQSQCLSAATWRTYADGWVYALHCMRAVRVYVRDPLSCWQSLLGSAAGGGHMRPPPPLNWPAGVPRY